MNKELEELIEELYEASVAYYQKNEPIMTDELYDDLLSYLEIMIEEYPEYKDDERVFNLLDGKVASGTSVISSDKIEHIVPMASLKKAKDINEVKKHINKVTSQGGTGYTLQAKLDGVALEVRYDDNGRLELLVTRGDGHYGENVTSILDDPDLTIVGIPRHLEKFKGCKIRGEVFVRKSNMDSINTNRKKVYGDTFTHPRMAISGIMAKAKEGLGYKATVDFVAYGFLYEDKYTRLDELDVYEPSINSINQITAEEWKKAGGTYKLSTGTKFEDVYSLINDFGEKRDLMDIPTDGAVIKPINEEYMYNHLGSTGHHPIAFIAFKYPSEQQKTRVIDIEISVGKTGEITPTLILEPVFLDGSNVSRATGHNYSWIHNKGIMQQSDVFVTKRNDIIPGVESVLSKGNGKEWEVPTHCPSCHNELVGDGTLFPKSLKCINDSCPSRIFFFMRGVTGKKGLDINGLSDVTLRKLCDNGTVLNVADLMELKESDLKDLVIGKTAKGNTRKLGKKRANSILNEIELSKTRTPVFKILNTLGMVGIGSSTFKDLLAHFGSVDSILNATRDDLKGVEGIGETRIDIIINGQQNARELLSRLKEHGMVVEKVSTEAPIVPQVSEPKVFAISGAVPDGFKNRDEFTEYMESVGHTFSKSVNKKTNVVFGSESDTSSKIKKAKELGILIVEPNEYKNI